MSNRLCRYRRRHPGPALAVPVAGPCAVAYACASPVPDSRTRGSPFPCTHPSPRGANLSVAEPQPISLTLSEPQPKP